MLVGYTAGAFDLFHVGHLNILRSAKSMCDRLIVGVSADEIMSYKNKQCIIPFDQRIEIVKNIKYVDLAIPQKNLNKVDAYYRLKYDILFVGDDWYGVQHWEKWEQELKQYGAKVIYFPRTEITSSSEIVKKIKGV